MPSRLPLIFGIITATLGTVVLVVASLSRGFNDWSWQINPQLASQYGSFVGGIVGPLFSLSAFLLILQSILNQRHEFQLHKADFELQKFETRFFELMSYHQENVRAMSYRPSSADQEKYISGRDVFIELKKQIDDLFQDLRKCSPNLLEETLINVTYVVFFYGVSLRTRRTTIAVLNTVSNEIDAEELIKRLREKKTEYNKKIVYYGGHQSKLGNYFRQMYHIVNYIDQAVIIDEEKKYQYVKTFRALLSNYEQCLLFFNSLSVIGKPWIDKRLINKYSLIKNISPNLIGSLDPKTYFPEIKFEYESYSQQEKT